MTWNLDSGTISGLMHTTNRAVLEAWSASLGTRSPSRHGPPTIKNDSLQPHSETSLVMMMVLT